MEEMKRKGKKESQPVINLVVPRNWQEMTESQLKYAFTLIAAGASVAQLQTLCLMHWSKLKLVCHYGNGYIFKHEGKKFYLDLETYATAVGRMKFLTELPSKPVRLERIGRHKALDATFSEVPFQIYLYCENLYQGYLISKDEDTLQEMGRVLYDCPKRELKPHERMNVFYWWTALKQRFAAEFPNFFVVGGSAEDNNLLGKSRDIGRELKDSMNTQIRGLTKGDVTKEKEILDMDTWRALTELDAMAKEYNEMQRKYGKH